jgi:hypothetical protein
MWAAYPREAMTRNHVLAAPESCHVGRDLLHRLANLADSNSGPRSAAFNTMPKFVTIGYGDREGYDKTDAAIRDAAHAHDARLRESGVLMGVAGTPVQVRNPDARELGTKTGPFMSSALPIAGIEAATLSEAVKIVSQTPCAVAHGVVEVWPLEQV